VHGHEENEAGKAGESQGIPLLVLSLLGRFERACNRPSKRSPRRPFSYRRTRAVEFRATSGLEIRFDAMMLVSTVVRVKSRRVGSALTGTVV